MAAKLMAVGALLMLVPGVNAPRRYRVEVVQTSELDRTPIGYPAVSGSIRTVAFVSVTQSDTAGGWVATMTIDSMAVEATGLSRMIHDPAQLESVKGQWLRAYVPAGHIPGTPSRSAPLLVMAPLEDAFRVLYPGAPAAAAAGATWSDTESMNQFNPRGGGRLGGVITDWRVTGATPDGLTLDGTSRATWTTDAKEILETERTTGTGGSHVVIQQGGPIRTGTLHRSLEMARTGERFPGVVVRGKATLSVSVSALP